jgi:hypothetical protein
MSNRIFSAEEDLKRDYVRGIVERAITVKKELDQLRKEPPTDNGDTAYRDKLREWKSLSDKLSKVKKQLVREIMKELGV